MPFSYIQRFSGMINRLKAEEALEGVMVGAVAFGSLKQAASDAQVQMWRKTVKIKRGGRGSTKASIEETIATATGMGIKVIREESSQKRS